jgi:hypothetical protein
LSFRLASLFGKFRRCNPADNFPFFDPFRTVVSADIEVQNASTSASKDKHVTLTPETADNQAVQHQESVSIVLEGAADGVGELEQLGTGQARSPVWSDSQASTSASSEPMYSMPLHVPSQNTAPPYVELEQLGTGQALSPAWSDSQASPSASSEPMYSMPLHAPSQNAAPAYDSSTSASTEPMYSMPLHALSQNAAPAHDLHSYFEPQERSLYDPFGRPLATPVVYAHGAELHSPTAGRASVSHAGLASAYPMLLAHEPVDLDCSAPMWATDTHGTHWHWQSDTPQCDEAQAHPEYPYMTQPYVPDVLHLDHAESLPPAGPTSYRYRDSPHFATCDFGGPAGAGY